MRDEVFFVHADAGIRDGESLVSFVKFEVNARRVDAIADKSLVFLIGDGKVAQFVERVGGIGDEFAEEDFWVGVERMNDQLEQLVYFSLELLFRHGISDYFEQVENPQPADVQSVKNGVGFPIVGMDTPFKNRCFEFRLDIRS